jgi:hypothetical protein
MRIVDLKLMRTGYVISKVRHNNWLVKWHSCNQTRINPREKMGKVWRSKRFIVQSIDHIPLRAF